MQEYPTNKREVITLNDVRVGSLLMSKAATTKDIQELWMIINIREDGFITVKKIFCNYGARRVIMVIPFGIVHTMFVCVD